jgi:O-antigen/teichoic acid export membrane protein
MLKQIIKLFTTQIGKTSTKLTMSIFGNVILAMLGFTAIFLVGRFLGKEALGVYSFFLSIMMLAGTIGNLGLGDTLSKLIAIDLKNKNLAPRFLKRSIISATITVIIFKVILDYYHITPNINKFWLIVLMHIMGVITLSILTNIWRSQGKIIKYFKTYIALRILFVSSIILTIFWAIDIFYILLMHSLSILLIAIYTRSKFKFSKAKPKTKFFRMSVNMLFMSLSFYAIYSIDKIAIRYVLDFAQLGLFSAYASIVNVIRLIAPAFPFILIPAATKNKYSVRKSVIKTLFFLLPLSAFVVVGAYVFVPILYGTSYEMNFMFPLLLAIPASLLIIYSLLCSIFVGRYKEDFTKTKILGMDLFVSTILNLGVNIYFIKLFGILGSPIATSLILLLKISIIISGYYILNARNKTLLTATPLAKSI